MIPPLAPTLDDENVAFVRRDTAGSIVSSGHMHRDHVDAEKAAGVNIEVVPEVVQISSPGPDQRTVVLFGISGALAMSDHYFVGDAIDNIDEPTQALWREYRKAVRAAAKLIDPAQMLAALPARDPKGVDQFASLRGKRKERN